MQAYDQGSHHLFATAAQPQKRIGEGIKAKPSKVKKKSPEGAFSFFVIFIGKSLIIAIKIEATIEAVQLKLCVTPASLIIIMLNYA